MCSLRESLSNAPRLEESEARRSELCVSLSLVSTLSLSLVSTLSRLHSLSLSLSLQVYGWKRDALSVWILGGRDDAVPEPAPEPVAVPSVVPEQKIPETAHPSSLLSFFSSSPAPTPSPEPSTRRPVAISFSPTVSCV